MKRSTLVAAGALLVLGGAYYWMEREDGSSTPQDTVFEVTADTIERIEIRDTSAAPIVLSREGDHFEIASPVTALADAEEVALILSNLAEMRYVRSMGAEADASTPAFGLDAPSLEVRFEVEDGLPDGIRFGNDTITPRTQYAQRISEPDVLIVADHLSNNLRKTAWDLRDKNLFHIDPSWQPQTITIHRASDTVVAENVGPTWTLSSPIHARADVVQLARLADRVRHIEMVALPERSNSPLANFGLESPTLRIQVSFHESPEPIVLAIGDEKSIDVYAKTGGDDGIYLVESGIMDELVKEPKQFVSGQLLPLAPGEVTAIEITVGDKIARHEAGPTVFSLLRTLSATTAEEIVTFLPTVAPSYVVEITARDIVKKLAIYEPREGEVYATRDDEDVALRLPTETWLRLDKLLDTALAQGGG